jgi:hypothetical protein
MTLHLRTSSLNARPPSRPSARSQAWMPTLAQTGCLQRNTTTIVTLSVRITHQLVPQTHGSKSMSSSPARNGRAQPSSPPNMVPQSAAAAAALARPHLSHTRKDSDTLRTLDPLQRNSPTARAVYAAQDPGRPASSLSSRRRPDTATPPGWGATERDSMPENGRRSRTPYGEQDVSPPHPGGPPSAAPVAHAASQPALVGQPPPGAPPQRTIVVRDVVSFSFCLKTRARSALGNVVRVLLNLPPCSRTRCHANR